MGGDWRPFWEAVFDNYCTDIGCGGSVFLF